MEAIPYSWIAGHVLEGERDYDYLNLYLSESTDSSQRVQNKNTLLLAEQIKAQRLLDLQSGCYKIKQSKTDESFLDHFDKMTKVRYNSTNNYGNWKSAQKHLINSANGKNLSFGDIDETWLNSFKKHFLN